MKTHRLEQLRRSVKDWPGELVLITDIAHGDDMDVRELTVNKLGSATGREPFTVIYNVSDCIDEAYWATVCKRAHHHFKEAK